MQKIGRVSEFGDGTITKVWAGGEDIVIVRDGTTIHAFGEIGSMFRGLHEAHGVRFRLRAKVEAFTGAGKADGVCQKAESASRLI